jgi:hypothetical protein
MTAVQKDDEIAAMYKHSYMMLGRLEMDLDYYFGHGNRSPRHLFYDSIEEHIKETKALLNSFPESLKPDWFTHKNIENYEALIT